MKKLVLFLILLLNLKSFGQPFPRLEVGVPVRYYMGNVWTWDTNNCVNQPPYYYQISLSFNPSLNPPPSGLRWVLVINSLNISSPDSAYTLESGTIHQGDTLDFTATGSYTIRIADTGYFDADIFLMGTPTTAGESYCCNFTSSGSADSCSEWRSFGDSCISTSTVLPASVTMLDVFNWGYGGASGYYVEGVLMEAGGGCSGFGHPTGPAIMVAVLDSCTVQPWSNKNVDHGNWNLFTDWPEPFTYVCRQRAENYFIYSFNDTTNGFQKLHRWITDTVPDGEFILIYSWTTYSYSNADTALNNLMSDLQCPSWPPADSVPFTFFVKKGFPSIMDTIVVGSSPVDSAFLTVNFTTSADCPVGVEEIDNADGLFIYPNPAHDKFVVSSSEFVDRVTIYDITGRLVHEEILNTKYQTLNTALAEGIYFVRISNGVNAWTQKLVVE